MKFEESLIGKSNKIISINELLQLYQNNKPYFDILRHDLYCPVCGKAKLALYIDTSSPFLKTKNNEKHDDNCRMKQPEMTHKERETFLKTADEQTIQHKMEEILSLLSKHNTKIKHREFQNNTYTKSTINNKVSKRIPHKRIDRPLAEDDYDVIKYFYGNVNIRFETIDKYNYSRIKVLSTDNKKVYCIIKITNNVYSYLKREYIINRNNVKLVYLGKINKFNNQNHSTAIKSYCIFIDE